MAISDIVTRLKVRNILSAIEKVKLVYELVSLMHNTENLYPEPAKIHDGQSFDYIIIGGGTAGCVVANRLTEANRSVLLVEAGDLPQPSSDIPAFNSLLHYSEADWNLYSTNDGYSSQAYKTKNVHLTQGKMLGGSSGLDYMWYFRGNKVDFETWAKLGNRDWEWDKVLPFFKKSEMLNDETILNSKSASLHGTKGYLGVTRPTWKETSVYLEAFEESGNKILLDQNGFEQLGYAEPQFTINNDTRQSTAVSYIRPIKDRPNLHILLKAFVTKIMIDKHKVATGVEILLENKDKVVVKAKKEVILCAGAIHSPKVLMLSGIGPKEQLMKHNIKVIHDSPNVGENLLGHSHTSVGLTGKLDFSMRVRLPFLYHYNTFGVPIISGFAALDKKQTFPHYETITAALPAGSIFTDIMCGHIKKVDDEVCIALHDAITKKHILYTAHIITNPKSKGKVAIQSNDPEVPAQVSTGFYKVEEDLELHAKYIEDYVKVLNTTYFRKVKGEVINYNLKQCKHHTFLSRNYWKCHILNLATTMWDLAGTCAMGPKDSGVVDDRLRAKGVKKLRVVDASVIPISLCSNIKATVIMIAEKGSDMIKLDNGDWGKH